ncbi:spore germination protein [Paenibacillus vietnamensis]|uniref:spore germination protein n=1 Tax=Paenibacillus vietnamensis TaxID=2590547 RepID=UPI001CD17187|nr:spore germination protein [Paenibacillus vietnamensis]
MKSKVLDEHFMQQLQDIEITCVAADLKANMDKLVSIFGPSHDVNYRSIRIGGASGVSAFIIYIDGLVNSETVDQFILEASMFAVKDQHGSSEGLLSHLQCTGLPIHETKQVDTINDVVHTVLCGDTALFVDGDPHALILNVRGWDKRNISEPATESVVRGPKEGFTETLRTNTTLIRRRLKDPKLRVQCMQVGKRSRTDLAIMYIEGLTNPIILEEVLRRIRMISIDAVLESGYIEQFIQDSQWTPFPLIQNTERPDKAVSHLLEGKVIIISDGTPFVLIAPAIFTQFYHSPEDYYERFMIGTLIRFIRILSMLMALLLPSLYIAFSSFHPEMIPSRLVIAMAAGRSTVPFPSIVEAFLMEVTMEILREASVRLPGPIGPTIGIVGALVVGQAAVQAGIVSPIMVIVVALTTIGSFASPSYSAAIALRMLRFPVMIAAALFGLYGIMLLLIIVIIHLCTLKSFGVPYLSPLTPTRASDLKDTLLRAPLQWMRKRPIMFVPKDTDRLQPSSQTNSETDASNIGSGNNKEGSESDEK